MKSKILTQDGIDIKVLLNKIKDNWKIFFTSIFLFLLIGILYFKFSDKTYQVRSSVMVRDEMNHKIGAENLLNGFELFTGKRNIDNEMGILTSYNLINKTVKKLNLNISYFKNTWKGSEEIYKTTPFTVEPNFNSYFPINAEFKVRLLSPSKYKLSGYFKKVDTYDFSKEILFTDDIDELAIDTILTSASTYENRNFNFKIFIHDHLKDSDFNNEYIFMFNDVKVISENYIKSLNVEQFNKDASILKLTSRGKIVEKEIDFQNTLLNIFIQEGVSEKQMIASNTIEFIDLQLNGIKDSLYNAESQLEKYRNNNSAVDLGYEAQTLFDKMKELETEKSKENYKEKYFTYLTNTVYEKGNIQSIIAPSTIGVDDPLLNDLIQELTKLSSEKSAMSLTAGEKNPYLNSINNKIENVKKTLDENLKNILQSSKISLKNVNNRLNEMETKMNKLPSTERQLISIQRKFTLNDNIYKYLLQKRAEASIAKLAYASDHKILDKAKMLGKDPVSPDKKIVMIVAFLLGCILPLTYIFASDTFNTKIKSADDIKIHTSIDIVGEVFYDSNLSQNNFVEDSKTLNTDQFRTLRRNIQQLQSDKSSCCIVAITSFSDGEGKTYCVSNLAKKFSQAGFKTLIVDGNFRNPSIHKLFNLNLKHGFIDLLKNNSILSSCITKTSHQNLDVVVSGIVNNSSPELLNSKLLKNSFTNMREAYDYIIIDTPSINLVSDYLEFIPFTDTLLYVIRSGYSNLLAIEKCNVLKQKLNGNKIAIILNSILPNNSNKAVVKYQELVSEENGI